MKLYFIICVIALCSACAKIPLDVIQKDLDISKKFLNSPNALAIHDTLLNIQHTPASKEYYRVMILEKEAKDSLEDFSIIANTTFTDGNDSIQSANIRQVIDLYFFSNGGVLYYTPDYKLRYFTLDTLPKSLNNPLERIATSECSTCSNLWDDVEFLKKRMTSGVSFKKECKRAQRLIKSLEKEKEKEGADIANIDKQLTGLYERVDLYDNKYRKMKQGFISNYDHRKQQYTIVFEDICVVKKVKKRTRLTLTFKFHRKKIKDGKTIQREALEIIDINYKNEIASQGSGYLTINAKELFNFGSTNNPNSYFDPKEKDNYATLWFKRISSGKAKQEVEKIIENQPLNLKNTSALEKGKRN